MKDLRKMTPGAVEEILRAMADSDPRVRCEGMRRIVRKQGGRVVRRVDADERILAGLIEAVRNEDARVKRAASYSLRPWLADRPELFADILPYYAVHRFDGSFTHLGLLDTRDGQIWIPPFRAGGGHATLMADGNTDRYFKFNYYLPDQATPALREAGPPGDAHLLTHYIADWRYSLQSTVDPRDGREVGLNLEEQARYERAVVRFYRNCRLGVGISVHRQVTQQGKRGVRALAVDRIDPA